MTDSRTWAKLDLGYLDNPKMGPVLDESPTAVLMHLAAVLYCAQHLTDGHLAPGAARRKVGGSAGDVALLVDAGLWHEPEHDCPTCPQPEEGRVYVHDFLEHNRSAAKARETSEVRAAAARKRHEAERARKEQSSEHAHPVQNAGSADANSTATRVLERERDRTPFGGVGEDAPRPPAKAKRKAPATALPAAWAPTEAHAAKARERGLDLAREAEAFRLHAEAHDRRAVRWDAAFSQWLLKARPTPTVDSGPSPLAAWNDYRPEYDEPKAAPAYTEETLPL